LKEPHLTSRARQAGFTLVELMAVVVITGILSIAGVAVFSKYIFSAKGGEALSTIQAIRAAEEAYAAENHVYLNVSTTGGANPESGSNWWPQITPGRGRSSWIGPSSHPDSAAWLLLAASVNHSVQFSYLANAGVAGKALTILKTSSTPTFTAPTQNWYVIQAEGDTDGDGVFARYASTSMTGEIYSEREGE
jgi:type IV pilus assembly protein PilA